MKKILTVDHCATYEKQIAIFRIILELRRSSPRSTVHTLPSELFDRLYFIFAIIGHVKKQNYFPNVKLDVFLIAKYFNFYYTLAPQLREFVAINLGTFECFRSTSIFFPFFSPFSPKDQVAESANVYRIEESTFQECVIGAKRAYAFYFSKSRVSFDHQHRCI